MRKLLFTVSFSYFYLASFSQEVSCTYFDFIHEAENAIVASQLVQAKYKYDTAFQLQSKPFCKDVFVSLLVDAKLASYDSTWLSRITYLFGHGYSLKRLKRTSIFSVLEKAEQKQVKALYKSSYLSLINTNLREAIFKLHKRDQAIRGGLYLLFFSGKFSVKDAAIHSDFVEIVEEYGYPGEHKVGITDYSFGATNSYLLALHYDTDSLGVLNPFLDTALVENQIHPLYYAAIQDRRAYHKSKEEKYGSFSIWDFTANGEKYAESRRAICLDSFDEHQKKISYSKKEKENINLIYLN